MRTGRNDPCSCGSGKRYKHCCGQLAATAASGRAAALRSAPPSDPGEADAQLRELIALLRAGQLSELEQRVQDHIRRQGESGPAWKLLGVALQLQHKDAMDAFERAAQLLPEDAETHANLAIARLARGLHADAIVSLRRALQLKPEDAELHNSLGNALRAGGELEDALANYRRAVELRPAQAELHNNLGNAYRSLQRAGDARASYRRALELRPDYAEAHAALGTALLELGEPAAALESLQRAVELEPKLVIGQNNLGNTLLALGRPGQALDCYRQVIELQPERAQAHSNLGLALLAIGRPLEALASCQRALELDPDLAEAHSALGNALLDLGRNIEALAAYRNALRLRPDFADALSNLAMALRLQGDTDGAMQQAQRALELKPRSVATLVVLSDAHADRGEFAEAEQRLREAIAIDPEAPQAWAGLAHLRKMDERDLSWLEQTQRIVARKDLAPRIEVMLRYALGKYLDDRRQYDQAFTQFQRANELSRRHRVGYDRPQTQHETDRLIRHRDARWLASLRGHGVPSRRPVLIVGMPRSGTSLIEQILASHPSVFGAGELPFWNSELSARGLLQADGASRADAVRAAGEDYLALLQRLGGEAARVVDKMPENFWHLGLIHAALPGARFIHVRRHPIDTCLSIYCQDFKASLSYATDPGNLAHYYREYWRLMQHWRTLLPREALLEVSYETLVTETEPWTRRLLEFLGLPWDPRCLDFSQTRRSVTTASKWQVRQRISTTSIGRWRHYARHLGELMPLLSMQEPAGADR